MKNTKVENKIKEKICFNINKNNERCKMIATYKAKSILGDVYYCKRHMMIKRSNICIANYEKINK